MHTLHIIFSKTDTFVGSCIRHILGGEYNHCSIALDGDLTRLYSFSRIYRPLWFTGYFCIEDTSHFLDYDMVTIHITDSEYEKITAFLNTLGHSFAIYNYLAAVALVFGRSVPIATSYTCSTFTARVLTLLDQKVLTKCWSVYTPMDLYRLLSVSSKSQYTIDKSQDLCYNYYHKGGYMNGELLSEKSHL